MFNTATLLAHRGATLVSRADLARYEPPPATTTWKPVKHSLVVDLIHQELRRRHIYPCYRFQDNVFRVSEPKMPCKSGVL
jgi:hypothetical protein